jgi:hypothetical protein
MSVRLCRVTITDIEGSGHVVEVKASSLFEAVALALKTKTRNVATDGFRPIKVLVFDVKAEYEVRLKDFMAWLDRRGNSPKEVIDRKKIRSILGISGIH